VQAWLRAAHGGRNRELESSVLKVDLHIHTADDPIDRIPYTSTELIDRAAALGFDALAITLHERQLDTRWLAPYAAERGVVLIPGVERSIEGRHVLLLNFRDNADQVNTFEELACLKQRQAGLVIAPHPFFPTSSCLRSRMERHASLFDAVEWNAMFTQQINFNRAAAAWAVRHDKPIVGNGDVHRLRQLGTTFSRVDAERDADAICAAILAGRVSVETRPLALAAAVGIFADLIVDFPRAAHTSGSRTRPGVARADVPVRVAKLGS
jgi:predicted metal-dependent phosphoesterase TrpH